MILKKLFKSNLFKSAGVYTIFNLIDRGIPFLLLPLITRYLLPEEYGVYVLYQALVGFVFPFVSLNTDSAILINYFKLKKTEFNIYLVNGITVFLINLIILIIIDFFLNDYIADLINFPKNFLYSILLVCPLQYFSKLIKNLWQVKKEPIKYGVFSVFLTLTKNLLMIIFVVGYGLKWQGLIYSQLIGWGIFAFISIYILSKNKMLSYKYNRGYVIDNLKVGIPLTLHQLGGWLGDLSSRLIIASVLGKEAVGSYGIGATFGMVVLLLQDAFNKAFVPYLFEQLESINDERKIKLVRITYLYNMLIFIVGLLVGLFGYYSVEIIFGNEYESSRQYIIWLTIAYAFDGMYKSHVNYIFFSKKTYLLLMITLTTGVLNVFLSYFLVGKFGTLGAAQSLLIVFLSTYLVAWYISNRVINMPWFTKDVFFIKAKNEI